MSCIEIVLDLAIAQREQAGSSPKNDADVLGVGSDVACLASPDLMYCIIVNEYIYSMLQRRK